MVNPIIDGLEARLRAGEDTAPLRFDLGSAYLEEENWEKAAAHLQAAVTLDASYSVAWKLLGQSFEALGRVEQARDAYENALGTAEKFGDIPTANDIRELLNHLNRVR